MTPATSPTPAPAPAPRGIPELVIVACVARDGAIGRDGDMIWHLRADLRRFRAITWGKPVIMGRLTFESLPKGALPGRRNIVITGNRAWSAPGAERASGLEEAMFMCRGAAEACILGGARVYADALPLASALELTEVDADAPGADTYFPPFDRGVWRPAVTTPWVPGNPPYRFRRYTRHLTL